MTEQREQLFTVEWERLHLLGVFVHCIRRGESLSDEMKERLESLQDQVLHVRQSSPWKELTSEFDLSLIDQDLTACVLAPEAEPRLGWLFQELQAGLGSHYPTPALICELFGMQSVESVQLLKHLHPDAPVISHGLIITSAGHGDMYSPLRPSARLKKRFFNGTGAPIAVTGAVEVIPRCTLNDLILPDYCKDQLNHLITWETHRTIVVDQWRLKPHGGPLALFAGPSGTGKTFAAEAVANELNKRLFRVDLGLLVSKYIGETEKNLNALFDSAAAADIVLLFDEADSLFGKRGQVREARDRYANMEVSHLLSRVERHQGMCILTSNLREYLDFAFTRRFHIIVNFPMPDEEAREKLWRAHFPPDAPKDPAVKWHDVARAVPLTGGQICNSALHAAYSAAGEGVQIGYKHIALAIWNELVKQGRETLPSSLGLLRKYLPERISE